MTSGHILHLQRLSTEDGPGIRTTVFFKGCPLSCAWCHNPESISRLTELQWFATRCIGCGTCIEICPEKCLSLTENGIQIDRDACTRCRKCAETCPTGALETLGKLISSDDLVAELEKDRTYYEKSGGGVTLSGGEPTFQPDFAEAILKSLKKRNISTALDTCGLSSKKVFEQLLPYTDLVLFDIKLLDNASHQHYTGHSNKQILENLLFIRDYIKETSAPTGLWIRTPLIPDTTDSKSNLENIGEFITKELSCVIERWDLCAFNNLCRDQYRRLGLQWKYADAPLMTKEHLEECESYAKKHLDKTSILHATGATRTPEPI